MHFMYALLSNHFHLQGILEEQNCTALAAHDDCDLQSVNDDGMLHSFAVKVENDFSAQLLGQLLSQSQLALGKLNVIFT